MSIETDLVKALEEHAGLKRLVDGRIYRVRLPEKPTLPAVTYQRISTPRQQAITGKVVSARPLFQLTVWNRPGADGTAYAALTDVAEQVRAAVLAMAGVTVSVHERLLDGEREDWEAEAGLARRDLEVRILHSE